MEHREFGAASLPWRDVNILVGWNRTGETFLHNCIACTHSVPLSLLDLPSLLS